MEVVADEAGLRRYVEQALLASEERPLLVDRYLQGAIEVDVDAISDGEAVVIGGVMEHVEHAGIHSGDSACALPPRTLDAAMQEELMRQTRMLARELGVVGLINVQFAIFEGEVYILEVNPRASRTIPFVSKAIGVPLAKLAALVMAGKKLADLGFTAERVPDHVSVKESVFPFVRFPGVDTILGPEMKSTGEVMGIDRTFAMAFAKAELAASTDLPGERMRVHQRARRGQGGAGADRARTLRDGLRVGRDRRHRAPYPGTGYPVRDRQQGRPRLPACRRPDARGEDRDGDQYAGHVGDCRLVFDPAHGARDAAAVLHHDGGGAGRGRGNRGA